MSIKFIYRKETDPYFNIAAEEYMSKHYHAPCLMLWQNNPSVIIGKHQNTIKEVNMQYAKAHNIDIVRRISGGGTVYHDLGNINFSMLYTYPSRAKVDFAQYLRPFIAFLQSLGLEAQQTGVSNISIQGFKCSGNACHLYKNKAIYHGTLLFDSNLLHLQTAISSAQAQQIHDKAINSVRVKVRNIKEQLTSPMAIDDFIQCFIAFMEEYYQGLEADDFIEKHITAIKKLAEEKYKSWDWTMAYSPKYTLQENMDIAGKKHLIKLTICKGTIDNMTFSPPISLHQQATIEQFIGSDYTLNTISALSKQLSI